MSPVAVRIARAALEVGVLAALGFLGVELTELDWGELAPFQGGVFVVLQFVEGLADQLIDPAQNRRSPAAVAGAGTASSGPVEPGA